MSIPVIAFMCLTASANDGDRCHVNLPDERFSIPDIKPSEFKQGQEYYWQIETRAEMISLGGQPKKVSYRAVMKDRVITGGDDKIRFATFLDPFSLEPDTAIWTGVRQPEKALEYCLPLTVPGYTNWQRKPLEKTSGFEFQSFYFPTLNAVGDTARLDYLSGIGYGNYQIYSYGEVEAEKLLTDDGHACVQLSVREQSQAHQEKYRIVVVVRLSDGILQRMQGRWEGEFPIDGIRGEGSIVRTVTRLDKLPSKPSSGSGGM